MKTGKSKLDNVELLKLAVPVATAILVALLTGWMGYTYSQLTQNQNALIAKRMELYDKIVKDTNAILSYYMFVGKWKRYTPMDIIGFKNDTDELMYSYQPMFSEKLFKSYTNLFDQFFRITGDWKDARLRTSVTCRTMLDTWRDDWRARFEEEDNRDRICEAYNEFMNGLAEELQLKTITGNRTLLVTCCRRNLQMPCL